MITESDVRFVLGLVAGEGSFYLSTIQRDEVVYVAPQLSIKLKACDEDLIHQIQESLDGLGYTDPSHSDDCWIWTIRSKDDLVEFCDLADEHGGPLWRSSEKYRNYQIWRDIVDVYADGQAGLETRQEMAAMALDRGLNDTQNQRLKELVNG